MRLLTLGAPSSKKQRRTTMRTVLVLLDTLNRHFLKPYNPCTDTITPNIESFADDSIRFENHFVMSAPCMPARRDLLTGRPNFLERNWGGIEAFDVTFPPMLTKNKIQNHIITDHTHYVEIGGENYLQQFETWDCIRGQEMDMWVSRNQKPSVPTHYGKSHYQYELNKLNFTSEEEYPTPKTFQTACQWAQDNKNADNFFLMVEGFDPHEPFDCPKEYLDMYGDDYDGVHYNWPGYDYVQEPPEATKHLRKTYQATLTMTDKWLGKFLDSLKENDLYEDTMIILTTDHGHMLGEHNCVGKNVFPAYNEMMHIPLFVKMPNLKFAGETRNALTQNIDMMPTILEYFNLPSEQRVQGKSMMNLINDSTASNRSHCIYGWFGSAMNITDGEYTYFKEPNWNAELNLYCTIPTTLWRYLEQKDVDMGRFLEHTDFPVYKFKTNLPINSKVKGDKLYNIIEDHAQEKPLDNSEKVNELKAKMKELFKEYQAPKELYARFELD